MPNYIHSCPGCGATARDIGFSSAYFDVYQCDACSHRYCHHAAPFGYRGGDGAVKFSANSFGPP